MYIYSLTIFKDLYIRSDELYWHSEPVRMGPKSQVLFMWASPNMKAKSQLLNLKKPLKYGFYSLKLDLD